MATVQAQIKLVSTFARFVQGDIKGGEHAHAYRKEIMANAIEQAFKGNYSPITEALTLTEGKAKKARAYAAGFAALGPVGSTNTDGHGVVKVAYKGSLVAHENKDARDTIAARTAHFTALFFGAFDVIMAEKAVPKAKAETVKPAATDDAAATGTLATPEQSNAAAALDATVTSVETMLRAGALTGEQTDRVADALVASMDGARLAALVADVRAALELRELLTSAPAGVVVSEAATV